MPITPFETKHGRQFLMLKNLRESSHQLCRNREPFVEDSLDFLSLFCVVDDQCCVQIEQTNHQYGVLA